MLAFGAGVYGDFTAENIEAFDDDDNAGKIVKKADAYFQIMNVVLSGNMNVEKFAAGYEDSETYDTSMYVYVHNDEITERNAALLNENVSLTAFYADGSGKIANTEVYTYTETKTVVYWNREDRTNEKKEVEYKAIDARLIFEDESKADLATYFGEGFDALITEFEKFEKDVNEDF